jgi:hypothetical protein
MTRKNFLVVNFTISTSAKIAIENLRQQWDAELDNPAAAVCIGWGTFSVHSEPAYENVFVSFYEEEQLATMPEAVQNVSGLKVVFFVTEKDHWRFRDKVIDYTDGRKFFLRERNSSDERP